MKKGKYQMTRTQTHHFQTHNQIKTDAIRRKSVVNTGKITRQTHNQATILIHPKTVVTDAHDVRGKVIGKSIRSNYYHV